MSSEKFEFPLESGLVFLNHAALAPLPVRARRAAEEFLSEAVHTGTGQYRKWLATVAHLREQLRALINAPSVDDIALLKNTSEGLSVVAHGFPWQAGDNLVLAREEFASNRMVWHALEERGVEIRGVSLRGAPTPEDALFAAVDRHTRLIPVSLVQYADGTVMDLQRIGSFCRKRDIALSVDAIQGLGALPFDVQACAADFVSADAHKWLLGPEGIALFYCAPKWRQQLRLYQHGWCMVDGPLQHVDDDSPSISETARRFEPGSLNMLGIHAFDASLSLLLEIGIEEVHRRLLNRSDWLLERIRSEPRLECLTPTDPGRYAGIVTFRPLRGSAAAMVRQLANENIVVAARAGGVRLSPHFYTPMAGLRRAWSAITGYLDGAPD
ncbi:MAG: aminotransferase class V-fold PLP-dependent enzyme [Gammaproteobacteria bacterium]|nr:aminotransferase class V-fold PLP-dependent enzyme [Gammaproteobacteria bacterium]